MPSILTTTRDLTLSFGDASVALPITIRYVFNPPAGGMRERMSGAQLEPDEPASIEILMISPSGIDAVLTRDMIAELERDIIEADED